MFVGDITTYHVVVGLFLLFLLLLGGRSGGSSIGSGRSGSNDERVGVGKVFLGLGRAGVSKWELEERGIRYSLRQ